MGRIDLGDEVRQQIVDEINHAGLAGFLEFKDLDPAVVTPSHVQLWLEFWVRDAAEEIRHHAYLRIEEQRSRANLRERTAYWYGLVDTRDPAVEYYEGLHFHADPPKHPVAVPHRKVTENGALKSWQLAETTISLSEAIVTLLRVYWERSADPNE